MPESALEVVDVTVTFGGIRAVDRVSVSVPRGALYGIVGANGSGKTTLLNAVSGFVRAEGQIRLLGHPLGGRAPYRRVALGLGRTFQTPKVSRLLTVWELLRIGDHLARRQAWWKVALAPWLAAREEREGRARAERLLADLGVKGHLLDARAVSLPQGTLKMIDVARALMANPAILLLDEPTSGMNEGEIENLAVRLGELNGAGLTIVIVEHNIQFVMRMCHEVAVLHLGRKLCTGPPEEVFSREDVIESYLGEPDVTHA